MFVLVSDEAEGNRLCEDMKALGDEALFLPAGSFPCGGWNPPRGTMNRCGWASSPAWRRAKGRSWSPVSTPRPATPCLPTCCRAGPFGSKLGWPCRSPTWQWLFPPQAMSGATRSRAPASFLFGGGIVDVYAAQCSSPIRIELWGDIVDTLSYFDLLTQRRTDAIAAADIPPAAEILYDDAGSPSRPDRGAGWPPAGAKRRRFSGKPCWPTPTGCGRRMSRLAGQIHPLIYPRPATALDYAGDSLLLVSEGVKVRERLRTAQWQLQEDIKTLLEEGQLCRGLSDYMLDWSGLATLLEQRDTVFLEAFARSSPDIKIHSLYNITARQLPVWSGGLELLCDDLRDMLHRNMACVVLAGAEEKKRRDPGGGSAEAGAARPLRPLPEKPVKGRILVMRGAVGRRGFPRGGLRGRHPRADRLLPAEEPEAGPKQGGAEIHSLAELAPGDYIVHAAHGIGLYQGIQQLEVQGVVKDYLKLQYDKGDTLYVPVTQLDLVSKYIGTKDEVKVKLHRLGGQEWQKAKSRVRAAVKDIAKELIQLYSKRMATPGYAFGPDTEWQYDFERHFEYEETEDQLRCIDEIKGDMERPIPMDRLLCGDVGFGKTEVALRAAFKCVSESKQCVLLVPTTILAFQHYNTIARRFEGFPVQVEMLSRFRTPKEQEDILRRTARGEIDILVGTHRMLSKDVKFHDLGLFIVDEEQRFGVAQKERIKELAPNIDVLTLSATPIPRTLNMAMSGIRDMSVIEEAPPGPPARPDLCPRARQRHRHRRHPAGASPGAGRFIICTTGWNPSNAVPPASRCGSPRPGSPSPTAR